MKKKIKPKQRGKPRRESNWRSKKQRGKTVRYRLGKKPKRQRTTSVSTAKATASPTRVLKEYRYGSNSEVYMCTKGHIARTKEEVNINRCGYEHKDGKPCGAPFRLVKAYVVRKLREKGGEIAWSCTCPAYRYSSKCVCGHELRYHRHGSKKEIGYCMKCGYMRCRKFKASGEKTCKHIEDAKKR